MAANFLFVGGGRGLGLYGAKALRDLRDNNEDRDIAVVAIMGRTDPKQPGIDFVRADLHSVRGCIEAVNAIQEQFYGGLDTIVFCNVSAGSQHLLRTKDGIEETLMTSYLSRVIIMKEIIKRGLLVRRKRVFLFGFPGQRHAPHDLNDLNFRKTNSYSKWIAYTNTIMLNEALTINLSKHYHSIEAYGLSPGILRIDEMSDGQRSSSSGRRRGKTNWADWIVDEAFSTVGVSPDQYARDVLKPLLTAKCLGPPGFSFSSKGEPIPLEGWAASSLNQAWAWQATEDLLQEISGGGGGNW